jgi:hypothetical protein
MLKKNFWDFFGNYVYLCGMNVENIITESITHQIDMDLLRELQKICKVNLEEEIELAERKFNTKLDRTINGMTNKTVHERNNI